MILNQLLLIVFLCVMNTIGATIPAENIVHIVLLTFLFWDGYYISGKNIKGNPVLSQFAILLVLFGWHFGLSLFGSYSLADTASVVILPICLYQLMNFVQAFLFQGANYKGRRVFLSGTAILCFTATLSFLIDRESFYFLYNIQLLVSSFGRCQYDNLYDYRLDGTYSFSCMPDFCRYWSGSVNKEKKSLQSGSRYHYPWSLLCCRDTGIFDF